jgi:hypothetical protein
MELWFTDRDLLVGDSAGALLNVLDDEAVPDGMPFVLDSDGSYCWELNRFLRQLPGLSVRSRASWRAYALDVVTWARFLALRRGKGLWDAAKEDIVAFHRVRRVVDPTASVRKATWNRSVADGASVGSLPGVTSSSMAVPIGARGGHRARRARCARTRTNMPDTQRVGYRRLRTTTRS